MPVKEYGAKSVIGYSNEELAAYRRSLAKAANQRIIRLERAGISAKGSALEGYAYKYLRRVGRERFSERKSFLGNRNQEYAEIANLERFLNAETSTVVGVRAVQKRIAKTFQDKGVDLSLNQIQTIMEYRFGYLMRTLGSDVVIAIMRAAGDQNISPEQLRERLDSVLNQPDVRDMKAEDVLEALGLDYKREYDYTGGRKVYERIGRKGVKKWKQEKLAEQRLEEYKRKRGL